MKIRGKALKLPSVDETETDKNGTLRYFGCGILPVQIRNRWNCVICKFKKCIEVTCGPKALPWGTLYTTLSLECNRCKIKKSDLLEIGVHYLAFH